MFPALFAATIMPKGFAYSSEELHNFLDIIKGILPISATAWECIAEVHLSRYLDMGRMVDSLKQKFKELHNKKVPTGNPLCPPYVARVKHLRHQIIDKMDGTDLNVEEDDAKEDKEDPDTNFLNGGGSNILSEGGEEK
jgi:hypothetical protein